MAYYKLHFQNKCTNGKCCGYIGSCLIDLLISEKPKDLWLDAVGFKYLLAYIEQ